MGYQMKRKMSLRKIGGLILLGYLSCHVVSVQASETEGFGKFGYKLYAVDCDGDGTNDLLLVPKKVYAPDGAEGDGLFSVGPKTAAFSIRMPESYHGRMDMSLGWEYEKSSACLHSRSRELEYPVSVKTIPNSAGFNGYSALLFFTIGKNASGSSPQTSGYYDGHSVGLKASATGNYLELIDSTGYYSQFSPIFHSGMLDANLIDFKDVDANGVMDIVVNAKDGLPSQVAFGFSDSVAGGYYFNGYDAFYNASYLLPYLLNGFVNAAKKGGADEVARYILDPSLPSISNFVQADTGLRFAEAAKWRKCEIVDFAVDDATAACERVNEDQTIGIVYIRFQAGANGWRVYAVG
jgi:hypothetical protein